MNRQERVEILSKEGLVSIAQLVEEQTDPITGRLSQNELAKRSGISSSTLTLLKRNKSGGGVGTVDDLNGSTLGKLLQIAPHLIDPITNQPFEVPLEGRWNKELCRFERIARGWEAINPNQELPNSRARHAIQAALKNNPGKFVAVGLKPGSSELAVLIKGEQPTLDQLSRLQKALGISLDNLMGLYDLSQEEEGGRYENAATLLKTLKDKHSEAFYREIELPMRRIDEIVASGQYTDKEAALISRGLIELEGDERLSTTYFKQLRDGCLDASVSKKLRH